jgi:hypothetical protein
MKVNLVSAISFVALVASSMALASASVWADSAKTGQFDEVATTITPRITLKTIQQVTFKGTRFRIDGADVSTYVPVEEIEDGDSDYQYIPSRHAALRQPLKSKPSTALDMLRDQTTQKLQGAQKTGEASINGFDCDVYTRDIGGGDKVTLYLSKDPQFPYVVKTILSMPAEGMTQSNSIENVKLDIPVSDDIFALPKGTKIVQPPADGSAAGDGSVSPSGPAAAPTGAPQ